MSDALKAAVVGAGRRGRVHTEAMRAAGGYAVAAVCDIAEDRAREFAEELDVGGVYTDMDRMLDAESPEVVVIATYAGSHAELTEQAAESGVGAICCEKPMATSLAEGRRMVDACRENGVHLVISHQRRMGAEMRAMRRLIEEGAIGEPYLLRGTCPGDLLTDGTHLVNSLRWLAGDEGARWVLGQVSPAEPEPAEAKGMGPRKSGGWRYGYPVEDGAIATWEFESGLRAEILTGDARFPGRLYQDYEAFGTEGRLWRKGDNADPPLLIRDGLAGGWREAPVPDGGDPMQETYAALVRTIREGTEHPLAGASVLRGLEIVMAIHESARTNSKISLPLKQTAYPLRLATGDAGL